MAAIGYLKLPESRCGLVVYIESCVRLYLLVGEDNHCGRGSWVQGSCLISVTSPDRNSVIYDRPPQ